MKAKPTSYSIGTGGWEHDVLNECFYPAQAGDSVDKLSYYSKVFDTVEARATFWDESLTEEDALRWIQAVRENRRFTFNVKLHSSFTHKKIIKPQITRNVRGLLHALLKADRLGTLLMQFPYSFTNTHANRSHLEKLAQVFAGYPMHVEFRHNSWDQPSTWDLLSEYGVSIVGADLPHLKQYMPYTTSVVNESGYLRLHGRNEKGWLINCFDSRYDYLYNDREVKEISRRITVLSQKSDHVTVIFNNTTGGKAIANALQLVSSLRDGKHVLIPEPTLKAFPHLQKVAAVVDTEQTLLGNTGYRQAM